MDAPPRWDSIAYRIDHLLKEAFGRAGPKHQVIPAEQTWESMTLFLFSDEQAGRGEVDQLVRDAIRIGRLPDNASPMARFYLGYRIQAALDFVGMVFPPEAQTGPFSDLRNAWKDGQLIEWLLIDLWVRRHDHWLKLNAIGLHGPFAFYGIGPATPGEAR